MTMKILFLSLTYPYPANNGHKMRTWSMLQALAAEQHEISLLTFAEAGEGADDGALRQICNSVQVIPLVSQSMAGGMDVAGRLRALARGLPYGVLRYRSDAMRTAIKLALENDRFDVLFVETPYALINVPGLSPVPILLDCHNIEHRLIERFIENERNPLRRFYARMECARLKAWEASAFMLAARVLVCSEHDRNVLKQMVPNANAVVVPNTVDTENYHGAEPGKNGAVLFTGGMDWFPNVDAVEYFSTKILPWVMKKDVAAEFMVAGRAPTEKYKQRLDALSH